MKNASVFLVGIVIVLFFSVGMYFLARKVNYALSYEAMVTETICQMVKPEFVVDGRCQ